MPVSNNGNTGVITGIAVGGLPDGIVDGDMLASGVGGKTLQVVQVIKKDVQSHTGTSFVDISNFNPSITPTGTNSKILLDICIQGSSNGSGALNVYRSIGGGSYAQLTDFIGDQHANSSNAIRTTMSAGGQDVDSFESFAMKILDTPSYSSGQAVAYKIQIGSPYHSTYIWYINRSAYLSNLSYDRSVISTFTLTEVAA